MRAPVGRPGPSRPPRRLLVGDLARDRLPPLHLRPELRPLRAVRDLPRGRPGVAGTPHGRGPGERGSPQPAPRAWSTAPFVIRGSSPRASTCRRRRRSCSWSSRPARVRAARSPGCSRRSRGRRRPMRGQGAQARRSTGACPSRQTSATMGGRSSAARKWPTLVLTGRRRPGRVDGMGVGVEGERSPGSARPARHACDCGDLLDLGGALRERVGRLEAEPWRHERDPAWRSPVPEPPSPHSARTPAGVMRAQDPRSGELLRGQDGGRLATAKGHASRSLLG